MEQTAKAPPGELRPTTAGQQSVHNGYYTQTEISVLASQEAVMTRLTFVTLTRCRNLYCAGTLMTTLLPALLVI